MPKPSESPLSPEHLRELVDAKERGRKIRRAAGVAALSGWSMAIFAAFTLAVAVMGDVSSLLVGLGLLAIAVNELRGAKMVRSFNLSGPRVLGWNQLGLAVLIVIYALWAMVATLHAPISAQVGSTGNPDTDKIISNLGALVAYGVYGTMAVIGAVVPGLTAVYYFSRAKLIRAMIQQTPPWVLDTIRAAA